MSFVELAPNDPMPSLEQMESVGEDIYDQLDGTTKVLLPKTSNEWVLKVKLSQDLLDKLCNHILNFEEEKYITRGAIQNIKKFSEMINTKPIEQSDSMMGKVDFIRLGCEAILEHKIFDETLIHDYVISNSQYRDQFLDGEIVISPKSRINNNIIKRINGSISDHLKGACTRHYKDKLISAHMKEREFDRPRDYTNYIEDILNEYSSDLRATDAFKQAPNQVISFVKGEYEDSLEETIEATNSPMRRLQTGIQFLNRMFSGGFESGTANLFLGTTGVGKSVILLSIARMIQKYNKVVLDSKKIPTVLYITQENSKDMSVRRLFGMEGFDIKGLSMSEVIEIMEAQKILYDAEAEGSINLEIRYYPDNSITGIDIESMMDDMYDEGKEVIALCHDYIGRLRGIRRFSELRHELGEHANTLSNIAVNRNIPVISAAQLNRHAMAELEKCMVMNKMDALQLINVNDAGESIAMTQNVANIIGIHRIRATETSSNRVDLFQFKKMKYRSEPGDDDVLYFVHPFHPNNGLRLVEDLGNKYPSSKYREEDLHDFSFTKQPQTQIKTNNLFNASNHVIPTNGASTAHQLDTITEDKLDNNSILNINESAKLFKLTDYFGKDTDYIQIPSRLGNKQGVDNWQK